MARNWFGGTANDIVFSSFRFGNRRLAAMRPNAVLTFWDSESGGTRHTDLLVNGSSAQVVTTDSDGYIPEFQGPDAVESMWADDGDGTRHKVFPALNASYVTTSEKGAIDGVATLDGAGRVVEPVDGSKIDTGTIPEARIPDLPYVQPDDLVLNVKDYGAVGDGVTDDTAAINALIASLGGQRGGTVLCSGTNGTVYRIDGELLVYPRVNLVVPAGVTLQRPAAAPDTSISVVRLGGLHAMLTGGGRVESLAPSPNGVVTIGSPANGAILWCKISPGITVLGASGATDVGVRFSGTSTFQNSIACAIHKVGVGVRMHNGANMNTCNDVHLYNIGVTGFDFDASLECGVFGGSIHFSANVTVFKLRGTIYTRVVGFLAEPGTGSQFWDIDAASTADHFIGCVHNTPTLGPNLSTSTSYQLNQDARVSGSLKVGGAVGFNGAAPVSKAADPGTATGTDAAVINAVVTALRDLGLVT